MKKIFFGKRFNAGKEPFWEPWGWLGCMGRLLGFLLLLLLLLFLLSLFKRCTNEFEEEKRDDTAWNQPIRGAEEVGLPTEGDNRMPPFEEMTPTPNPEDGGVTEIYPDLLYVIFDSDANDDVFKTFAKKFTSLYSAPEHKIAYYNTGSKTAVLQVPEARRDAICDELPTKISEVKFLVVPVMTMLNDAARKPSDPGFNDASKSWFFAPIQAYEAWSITQGSSDIIVGIVDSYMDLNHPELKGDRCIHPYSVMRGNSDVSPSSTANEAYASHGTLVTSVAVGNANNGAGVSGIAPKCKFIPVSMGENLNTITMVEGLLYCMYHNASVINLSCGMCIDEDEIARMSLTDQIEYSKTMGKRVERMWAYVFDLAKKRNVTIVWSAGNSNCFSAMDNSKRNHHTIVVSAVDENLKRADFSNFGNFKDLGLKESTISAPGVKIYGAISGNRYDAWDGTSFSAPIITGVVALLRSENKDLTTSQIIRILQETGKPVASAPEIGNLVQIKDALLRARSMVSTAGNREDTSSSR